MTLIFLPLSGISFSSFGVSSCVSFSQWVPFFRGGELVLLQVPVCFPRHIFGVPVDFSVRISFRNIEPGVPLLGGKKCAVQISFSFQ